MHPLGPRVPRLAAAAAHTSACLVDSCAVSADTIIHCPDDPYFAANDVAVGIESGEVLLSLGTSLGHYLFRLSGEDMTQPGAPQLEFKGRRIAVTADGDMMIAGVNPEDDAERLWLLGPNEDASAWTGESVRVQPTWMNLLGFAFDEDDQPRLWFTEDQAVQRMVGEPGGGWSTSDVDYAGYGEFGLTHDDHELTGHAVIDDDAQDPTWSLIAYLDGDASLIADGYPAPPEVLPLFATRPGTAASGPDAAFLLEDDTGLSLTIDGVGETAFPDTLPISTHCETPDPDELDSCGPPCFEQDAGIADWAYATVRGSDGRAWVAWLHTTYNIEIQYAFDCIETEEEVTCYCKVDQLIDASQAQVRVAEVDLETAEAQAVFALDVPATWGSWHGSLAMHADGGSLVLTTGMDEPEQRGVRVIQLEL